MKYQTQEQIDMDKKFKEFYEFETFIKDEKYRAFTSTSDIARHYFESGRQVEIKRQKDHADSARKAEINKIKTEYWDEKLSNVDRVGFLSVTLTVGILIGMIISLVYIAS